MTDQEWTVTSPQTIDVDGVTSLKLGMVQGRFDVVMHQEPVTRLEISDVHGDPVAVSLSGGRLEVRHQLHGPQGWFKNLMGSVNHNSENSAIISIEVPVEVDVEVGTVSGDMTFDLLGFTHDFGANSVSGDLTIRLPHDVGVDIVAKSASGAVVIGDQRYTVVGGKVETIAGPDGQLMLVRTNSVSGKTSIFHRTVAGNAEAGT